jgi:hypothetical protein
MDLLGTWSEDAMYAPGAQSDTRLYFRGDGLGARANATFAGTEATVFRWSLADGALTTHTLGGWYQERGPWEPSATRGWDLSEVPVTVTVEDTYLRPAVRVLRLGRDDDKLPAAVAQVGENARWGLDELLDQVARAAGAG